MYIRTLEDRIKEIEDLMYSLDVIEPIADEMTNKESAEELRKAGRDAWHELYRYRQELKKELIKESA